MNIHRDTRHDRFQAGNKTFPILGLAWSPSGKWLVIETLGEGTSSTSPQSDLFVLDATTMKRTKVGSGISATWLPTRDELFYVSPREMAHIPGARHPRAVWIQHLIAFNPASGKTTAITSGVTNNLQPAICGK